MNVAVDLIIFYRQQLLLIRRKGEPFAGSWALPGGFVEDDEYVAQAAVRELEEETAVKTNAEELRFVGYFDAPDRDPRGRVISFAFSCHLPQSVAPRAGDDAAEAHGFALDALPPLAFDHARIIEEALGQD